MPRYFCMSSVHFVFAELSIVRKKRSSILKKPVRILVLWYPLKLNIFLMES